MEQERIRELVRRYYEGQTTEEEEALLRALLSDPSLPASLRSELGCMASNVPYVPEPSDSFSGRLEEVTHGMTVTMPQRKRLGYLLGAAATIAIITGTYITLYYLSDSRMRDSFRDPEIAMAEVKSILITVSSRMTEAARPLGSINNITNVPDPLDGIVKINGVIGKNLSRLRYLEQPAASTTKTETN